MIPAMQIKGMEKKSAACAAAEVKPMAAYWYEQDVPLLLKEIAELEDALHLALWRAA